MHMWIVIMMHTLFWTYLQELVTYTVASVNMDWLWYCVVFFHCL